MPASPEDGARHAAKVTALIEQVEAALLRQLAETLAAGGDTDTSEDWATQALYRLRLWRLRADRGIAGAQAELAEVVASVMVAAHTDGYALALTELPDDTDTTIPGGARVLAQADDLTTRVMAAMQQVPRLLEATYREAVQAGAAEVTAGKATRLQASQQVLDRLGSRGITGFRDVAGRNWSLTSYTEMAVRTETGRVAIDGHAAALVDAGQDLVKVSDSPRECPTCAPWEGKVLSLTGATVGGLMPSATGGPAVRVDVAGTLAQARARGLFHPNCTHSHSLYLPGATSTKPAKADPDGYAAKQRQRAMERKVREWKRREALALDDAAKAQARAKVRDWQSALREHVDANDLKRLTRREQIGRAI